MTQDCRIRYTNNFNTEIGVTNGTLGTLRYVYYEEDEHDVTDKVKYLLVKFDEDIKGLPCVEFRGEKLFAIERLNWASSGKALQFPITVTYAGTYSGVQGLTFKNKLILGLSSTPKDNNVAMKHGII